MPFWVYGNDRETGEREKYYSNARDDNAARAEATKQGLFVERVEMADEPATDNPAERPDEPFEGEPISETVVQSPRGPAPAEMVWATSPYISHEEATREQLPSRPIVSIFALYMAEGLAVLACMASLIAIPTSLVSQRNPMDGALFALLSGISFFYNLALAAVFSYVRKQLQNGTQA